MSTLPWHAPERVHALLGVLEQRILILDGAMGTMIQRERLGEDDYRGERFAGGFDAATPGAPQAPRDLKGNNDLLNLTRPGLIRGIHQAYLEAGADLVETNTFNSTAVSQSDYGLQHLARELNREGARLARAACDAAQDREPGRQCFAVGVIGPTSRTASISPDVTDPGFRAVTFDDLVRDYREAVDGLVEGGADLLMVETVFDTLNAKAALFAISQAFDDLGARLPVIVSGTITDASGRTLSGQTAEAFWYSVRHARPLAIGLNCALGASELRPHMQALAEVADCFTSAHPNAGLPNAFGEYDQAPEEMAPVLADFARSGLVNIIGGCCGTTPEHIRAIADAVHGLPPRSLPRVEGAAA